MKLDALMVGFFCVLLAACGSSGLLAMKPAVEVEVINQSSHDLRNTEARFEDHGCKWGAVVRNTSASYMYCPYPITAQLELHWDVATGHRAEKLDLGKIYPRGKSGRLTFTVYNDRVEANFCASR